MDVRYRSSRFCGATLLTFAATLWIAPPARATPLVTSSELAALPAVVLPFLDAPRAAAEEALRDEPGRPHRFARARAVSVTPATGGRWLRRADGRLFWRLRVHAPGATSLNLGFRRFHLPPSAELHVASADGRYRLRPFTAADNEAHGELWTPVLPTDDLVLELRVAPKQRGAVRLQLSAINQGFRAFGTADPGQKASGGCHVDVVCPVAAPYSQQVRAVGVLSIAGDTFCSGSLVNNTAQDGRLLFVTAKHCGVKSTNAASLVVHWRYENSTCRGEPGGAGAGDGTLDRFNSGSMFRAADTDTDFTLVELDDPAPASAAVFLAGWDRRDLDHDAPIAIHHPATEEKRITFSASSTAITSYFGATSPGDGTHLHATWSLGVTEPGSSGSPLYSPEGRFLGQLHGGPSACGATDTSDYYGRLTRAWTGGGTRETRLAEWLDPVGTGAEVLDGREVVRVIFSDGFESGTLEGRWAP